jgi:tetratricopeptide (TPR) repeat protein
VGLDNLYLLLQSNRYSEAVEGCLELLRFFPGQPKALHLLAVAYAKLKRFDLALEYFDLAVGSAPQRSDFLGNYANACWECGLFDRAKILAERAIKISPKSSELYNIRGNILLSQSKFLEAERDFREAISLRSDYFHAENNLGNSLQRQGKNKEAVVVYRVLLDKYPQYSDAWCNLASAYQALDDYESAFQCFDRALTLQPHLERAKVGLIESSPSWSSVLEGRRLIIRRQDERDANFLSVCYSNTLFLNNYNRYLPRFRHPDVLREQLSAVRRKHPCQVGTVDWIVARSFDSNPIGVASLTDILIKHRRAELLLGFPDKSNQVNGVGIEAALLILDFAFNRIGLNKLISFVYSENVFAQENILGLGFLQEAKFRSHIIDASVQQPLDLLGYGMLVSDFRSNKRISKLSKRLLGRDVTTPA